MATLNISHNIKQIVDDLDAVRLKQVPFATKNTLNALATTAKAKIDREILTKLDRPTRYTTNMMRIRYATKSNLTAEIKVKDTATLTKSGARGPDQILGHLFTGGKRSGKGMEGLLRNAGILPAGMYVVPGEGAKLDANGNLRRGLIIQLLSYFRAFRESGFRGNMTDKSSTAFQRRTAKKLAVSNTQFFFVRDKKPGGLHPGIWQRFGFVFAGKRKDANGNSIPVTFSSVKPILMFVSKTQYRQYFDLESIVDEVLKNNLDSEFVKALDYAIATAK